MRRGAVHARRSGLWSFFAESFESQPGARRPHRGAFSRLVAEARQCELSGDEVGALERMGFMEVWGGLLQLRHGRFRVWLREKLKEQARRVDFAAVAEQAARVLAGLLGRRFATAVSGCSRLLRHVCLHCPLLQPVRAMRDVGVGPAASAGSDSDASSSGPPDLVSQASSGRLAAAERLETTSGSETESGWSDPAWGHRWSSSCFERFGWASKCLQSAVVRLLVGSERNAALAYFRRACANSAKSGHAGGEEERANFVRVLWFLVGSGAFAWVYEPDGVAAGTAWRLGDPDGRCLGALC